MGRRDEAVPEGAGLQRLNAPVRRKRDKRSDSEIMRARGNIHQLVPGIREEQATRSQLPGGSPS